MEKRVGVSTSIRIPKKKKMSAGVIQDPKAKYPKKKFYDKRRQPYLLPCGNEKEHCFLKVRRNNTNFCKTWKKIIWAKCRHHVETEKYKWEER